MKSDALVRNIVKSVDPGSAGVVIVKLPRSNGAVARQSGGNVHYAGGTKICPGKFLFAGPLNFHRTFRRTRKPGGFDGGFAGVFSSISRTRIQHDHADIFFRNLESFSEFTTNAEGALRSSPNRQVVARPLCKGYTRFKRGVRDVCNGVSL